jgi:hypothetical protein
LIALSLSLIILPSISMPLVSLIKLTTLAP